MTEEQFDFEKNIEEIRKELKEIHGLLSDWYHHWMRKE